MSLKLRIKYQYRNFLQFFTYWQMPAFVDSRRARWAVCALLVVVGGAYIFEVNALATRGYEVEQLEAKMSELQTSNQELATDLAAAQSLTALKTKLPELNMVEPTKVVRLTAPALSSVAER
jgi:outer membrane murein-binding lipoprotein Lpp